MGDEFPRVLNGGLPTVRTRELHRRRPTGFNAYCGRSSISAGSSFRGVLTRVLTGCAAIIPAGQGLSSAFNFVVAWLPGSSHAASEIQFSSDLPLLFVAGPR